MVKYNLYLRQDDAFAGPTSDMFRFCINFLKGGLALWMLMCLVVALSVALSTYLSGVITLLTSCVLIGLGLVRDFIEEVARRTNVGGGPLEGMIRLVLRPGGAAIAAPLDETTGVKVSTSVDKGFSLVLSRVMDAIPDVNRFSFTNYVSEGVAISGGEILMTFLLLIGYILPFIVLAYYLLKWREWLGILEFVVCGLCFVFCKV